MIIGLTGFIASGKSEVAKMLATSFGFVQLSVGDEVRAEAKKQGIEPLRENLQKLGQELPAKFGADYWINRLTKDLDSKKNYVIDGIRNIGDVLALRKYENFVLVAIDASFDTRANRVLARQRHGDPTTIDAFQEIDDADKGLYGDVMGQSTEKCVALADYTINNSVTIEQLESRVTDLLYKIDTTRFNEKANFSHND